MPDLLPFSDPSFREAGAVRIREEREPGAVLAAALNLTTAEARPLFTAVFAIAGPMVLLAALARVVGGAVAGSIAGSVLDVTASLLSSAAVFGFVRLYAAGLPTEVADVWDAAKGIIAPLFAYTLLVVAIAVALAIPLTFGVTGIAALSVPLAGVVGAALFAAGFVYVLPVLSLGIVAVGLDGMRAGQALRHVQELIRGRRRRVLLTILLMLALGLFALLILSAVVGTLVVAGLASSDPTGGPAQALSSAVLTLVALPVGVVSSLVWVFLYGSLVDVVEGASLGSDLDRLAGTNLLGVGRRPEAPRADATPGEARHGEPRLDEAPPESFRPPADARSERDDAPPSDASGFRGGGFQNP